MSKSYIPSKEADLATWSQNFSALISASPGSYGMMASDASAISVQVNLFTVALTLATNPATKTKATVADKNGKKAAMLVVVRQYAQTIKRNQGVSDLQKVALGLTIDDTTRTPVPPPTVTPLLLLTSAGPLRQTLRIADVSEPNRKSKPPGVQGMVVMTHIGTTPPTSALDTNFKQLATKPTADLTFEIGDVGKNVYVYGAFYNPAGMLGPISAPVVMSIVA